MNLLFALALAVLARGHAAEEPSYVLKDHDVLPKSFPLTQTQVLQMIVPGYEAKLAQSFAKLADTSDPMSWWHTYEAAVMDYSRTNLGVPGEDFVLVAILEIDEPCNACRHAIFGVIDLSRVATVGKFRAEQPSLPANEPLKLVKQGNPWRVSFAYVFGSSDSKCGIEWVRSASLGKSPAGAWELQLEPEIRTRDGVCDEP